VPGGLKKAIWGKVENSPVPTNDTNRGKNKNWPRMQKNEAKKLHKTQEKERRKGERDAKMEKSVMGKKTYKTS